MVKVTVDQRMIEQQFKSSRAREMWTELGDRTLQTAKSMAPVRTGHYRDGLTYVIKAGANGVLGLQMQANDFKSFWIEFGTSAGEHHRPTPAAHVLARAVEAETHQSPTGGKGSSSGSTSEVSPPS